MQELINFLYHHPYLTSAIIAVLVLLLIIETIRVKRRTFFITPQQAIQLINRDNAVIIDIRSPENFRKGHIIDAQSFAPQEIFTNPKKIEKYKNRPLIIVCGGGVESQKIAAQLHQKGFNAYTLMGGIRGWNEAQLPLIKE